MTDGFYLASSGSRLLNNHIEAFKNGPGVRVICKQFSDYKDCYIDGLATYYDYDRMADVFADPGDIGEQYREFLASVISRWVSESVNSLRAVCCEEGSPWWITYHRLRFDAPIVNRRIPAGIMSDYFTDRYLEPAKRGGVH